MSKWHIEGQYFETCNCEYLCPCIFTNSEALPTEGNCDFAISMRIDNGEKDGVNLDGVACILLMRSPGVMADGGFTGGLIIDEKATEQQVEAITAIMSGKVGGPMGEMAPLVEEFKGIEKRPIEFKQDGMHYAVKAGELVDHAGDGVPSLVVEGEPLRIENADHPVNHHLALAKAQYSKFNAFGIEWEDSSGKRNAHFAPFSWAS